MQITDILVHKVNLPLVTGYRWASGVYLGATKGIVEIQTDAGIVGWGEVATVEQADIVAHELAPRLHGVDPSNIDDCCRRCLPEIRTLLNTHDAGLVKAFGGLELALWDIKGKALGQSLAVMLGGLRDRVPTYASGALSRTSPLEHVVKAGPVLVEKGFKQMKMQLALPGDTTPAREVERARLIREAVGPDIDLMCDINQRWSVNQAIGIGRRIEEFHLFWLEDVTVHDDYTGLARVADALATPLAGGECVYGITPFRHMIEARSVDIVMIDLLRVGGIANWMKVAGMAEAFNLTVVVISCPRSTCISCRLRPTVSPSSICLGHSSSSKKYRCP
jgi:L-alanine-DL-glutamate epimerase-like enolase superfamily enzyme